MKWNWNKVVMNNWSKKNIWTIFETFKIMIRIKIKVNFQNLRNFKALNSQKFQKIHQEIFLWLKMPHNCIDCTSIRSTKSFFWNLKNSFKKNAEKLQKIRKNCEKCRKIWKNLLPKKWAEEIWKSSILFSITKLTKENVILRIQFYTNFFRKHKIFVGEKNLESFIFLLLFFLFSRE